MEDRNINGFAKCFMVDGRGLPRFLFLYFYFADEYRIVLPFSFRFQRQQQKKRRNEMDTVIIDDFRPLSIALFRRRL